MADSAGYFSDGEAYEKFMGRWSRRAGEEFLDWLAPAHGARWLEVGCGTGVFTELVINTCAPSALIAVDPSCIQIEHARRQPVATRAEFHVAAADSLPFPDDDFDIVALALVINFIPEPAVAMAEMRRVARSGGTVAGYIWDFGPERSPSGPFRVALRQIGIEPPAAPGANTSALDKLQAAFADAGFEDVTVRSIDVKMRFANFEDLWQSQTPVFNPMTRLVAELSGAKRMELTHRVRALVSAAHDGTVTYSARANAVKARVPS